MEVSGKCSVIDLIWTRTRRNVPKFVENKWRERQELSVTFWTYPCVMHACWTDEEFPDWHTQDISIRGWDEHSREGRNGENKACFCCFFLLFLLLRQSWKITWWINMLELPSLQLWAGLRFTVPRLKDQHKTVQFELQIRRYTAWTHTAYRTCYSSADLHSSPMTSANKNLLACLRFHSKNENNSHSEVVPYKLEVVVQADVILQGWVEC